MKIHWESIGRAIIYIFAIIGFVLIAVYTGVQLGWTNTSGFIDTQHDYFKNFSTTSALGAENGTSSVDTTDTAWTNTQEWQVLDTAIAKDTVAINTVATKTGIPARVIVAPLVVEQMRLFYSDREIFKEIFAPLKILGDQSQFSWGVMGIKQDTAREIENNLKDSNSPWYLGPTYEHTLDYPATDTADEINAARFARLTNQDDRTYSYLYAALCIKEIESQWQKAGFPIADRPDIVATLFNIGFADSHPHADPQAGGAEIDIGSSTYSFGSLAGSFYASNELTREFPR